MLGFLRRRRRSPERAEIGTQNPVSWEAIENLRSQVRNLENKLESKIETLAKLHGKRFGYKERFVLEDTLQGPPVEGKVSATKAAE